MKPAEIIDRIMRGNTNGLTKADIDKLYPQMPLTAARVWENVQAKQYGPVKCVSDLLSTKDR